MGSPEIHMGSPEQKNVQTEYVTPSHSNDGAGSLTITHGNNEEITFRLNSQYLDQPTIDKIRGLFNDARNDDERAIIVKKIRMAIENTGGGQTVGLPVDKE